MSAFPELWTVVLALCLVNLAIAWWSVPTRTTGCTGWATAALLALSLALTGCSATATYTRDTLAVTCHKPATYPGSGLLGLLTAPAYAYDTYQAATRYSQCKSQLEAAGFTRQP